MRSNNKMLWLAIAFAIVVGVPAAADVPDPITEEVDRQTRVAVAHGVFGAEEGRWVERSQLVFNRGGHLVRRHYRAWDPHPSLNLEFAWSPQIAAPDQIIDGRGRLTWRLRDAPIYAPDSIYESYEGEVFNGRPHGRGLYERHDGLAYSGEWRDGLQHGQGDLTLPNGDVYIGPFDRGVPSGQGMYIEATGEVFRGVFAAGVREGPGEVTLPDGGVYRSRWRAGRDLDRNVRFAQLGAAATTDVSLRIVLDRFDEYRPDLHYRTYPQPDRIEVRPVRNSRSYTDDGEVVDHERFMDVWKGSEEIQLITSQEIQGTRGVDWDFTGRTDGLFSMARELHPPLGVTLVVQNREAAEIRVVGAFLDVRRSTLDRQPAIQLDRHENHRGCGLFANIYFPSFTLQNYGWGEAEAARVRFAFFRPEWDEEAWEAIVPETTPDRSLTLGTFERTFEVDFTSVFINEGVDVGRLELEDQRQGVVTPAMVGNLSPLVTTDESAAEIGVRGQLEYEWRDHTGRVRSRTSPFTTYLSLGRGAAPDFAECGDGTSEMAIRRAPVHLRLSGESYRVPVALQRTITAGGTGRLSFAISAEQASQHDLAIVVQLADGREIRTRPIDLLYFIPSWFPEVEPLQLRPGDEEYYGEEEE